MKALPRLHRCAFTLEYAMSTYPISTITTCTGLFFCNIITIVIILAVNHSYNLSLFRHKHKNVQFISTHTVLKKRGGHLFSFRKQILVFTTHKC